MVVYKNGDILNATENIICHQVNVEGVMGGGLAKQIASAYPKVLINYKQLCKCFEYDYEKLKGFYQFIRVSDNQQICNCFTQKPVNVLKELIKIFTDVGDVVIDPVAGSGSTLRACAELDRSCYGFEIKKDFCKDAEEKMLKNIDRQMSIFDI